MSVAIRKLLVIIGSVAALAIISVVGIPYAKFGASNEAWAESYTLTGANIVFQINASIPGQRIVGGATLVGFNTYNINTITTFGVTCPQVVVYRQTEFGDLIRHKEVTCNGNIVSIQSVGTGTYFFAITGNLVPVTGNVLLVSNLSNVSLSGLWYFVQPGDTLSRLALRFNSTVDAIVLANSLPSVNLIFVGQRLLIPTNSRFFQTNTFNTNVVNIVPATGPCVNPYTVRPGDTLFAISRACGVSAFAVASVNGLVNPNLILVGQRLFLPAR